MCGKLIQETTCSIKLLWKDNNSEVPASNLLLVVSELCTTNKASTPIQHDRIADYLEQNDYVAKTDNGEYAINEERRENLNQLRRSLAKALNAFVDTWVAPIHETKK